MAVNDVFELAVTWDIPGADGEVVNVLHYRQTTYDGVSSSSAMGNLVAQEVIDQLVTFYIPDLINTATLERVDWFIVNDPIFGGSVVSGVAGLDVSEAVSLRSAPVVKKVTELRGRSFQGRLFLLPPGESRQVRGIISGAFITILNTLMSQLRIVNDVAVNNVFQMTVFSRALSVPPGLVVDNTVQSFFVNPVMGSVRGRQSVT